MEKSMIQDLDGMRLSLGFRNTFTTSSQQGGYQFRKSKISNLPSYKRSDLSIKLPFVVTFQTIQIERLSQQIEALRIALKDSQRQAFNCQSYEVQIRELTDQCHEYDIELLEYKQEIQKLNMISQKLYQQLQEWKQKYQNFDPMISQKYNVKLQQCLNLQNQIGKWRDRYRALEKSKDKEMQDLKLAMQSQRKSVLDRQIRQLNIKFQAQRSYLQGQIRKMQEAADQRDDELTKAKFQAQTLRMENQVNLDATRKLKQSQNKLNRNTQQLVRVNELLRRKHEQIARKDANEQYLKQLIKTLQRQKINHQNQAIKVPQLEGAIKQWAVRYSRLQNQSNQNKQLLQKVPVLQNNFSNCSAEIERLNIILKTKLSQINQGNVKIEKYRSLYEQSKKSQEKVPTLERRIKQMNYQAERYNDILKKRLIQVEQGKARILSLQKALRVFQQAEPERRRIQQELKKQIRQVQKYKKQIKQLQKQLKKIPELEAVLRDQRNIRQQYTQQVDRLNKVSKDQTIQNQTLSQKIFHLENKVSQLSNIEQQLKIYSNQNNKLIQQIDKMNNKIKQKCEQLQGLTQVVINLQKNLQNYKIVEQKLIQTISNTQQIITQLNNTKTQLQNTQNNLLQCQSQLNDSKNTIIQINNDKQMLNRNLNLKTQELQQANIEIKQYLQQIHQLRQIQRCYYVLQQDVRVLQSQLQQTEEHLKRQKANNDQLQYKNQMLMNQIQKIRINGYFPQEFRVWFDQVKVNARLKQRQIDNLIRKQIEMEKYTDDIHGIIVNICDTMKIKNFEWVQINKKIAQSFNNWSKILQMQQEMGDLKTQNLQLESQIKLLNLEILQHTMRKNTPNPITTNQTIIQTGLSNSSSSWSFNTVPSKKAIDPIIEQQTSSRISNMSNNKRILSSTENIVMNSTSRSKLQDGKNFIRTLDNKSNINNTQSNNPQLNNNQSSVSINSTRGLGYQSTLNNLNSYVSPSKLSSTFKESTQTYFTTKTMKTSSVREPFTFKSSYRA